MVPGGLFDGNESYFPTYDPPANYIFLGLRTCYGILKLTFIIMVLC